ncbi:ATP-dependent zinc protease [Alkalimarinus sediminis]|uniref:ATP-dependent zinc protease n=1 Tax=Alkalimarinus sediminis TaxID=1632866 RepID=A0A9E8HL20_9ALTE|nr:ATP-dependent zinc protease [Alkalimarinus sediminis]UZW74658.1 ATP-dependent zinc protease [Alkalimarinus sediminis]
MITPANRVSKSIGALLGALLLVLLAGCQNMQQQHKADCDDNQVSASSSERVIIGAVEKVALPEQKISLDARIDTGATTTSINAQNIKQFERDGKKWVKFEIHNASGKLATLEKPVSRVVNIKRHGAADQNRYAVKVKLKLGEINLLTEVTLADRAKFTYPLLIGRNFLQDMAIVDVSKEYTVK